MGDAYLCVEENVENAGRIIPSALVESGCRIADGRADRRPRGARARRHGRRGHDDRARRRDAGRRDRRELHAARLHRRPAACGSATTARRGHERDRRGRRRSAPATSSPTARACSPASRCPTARCSSMDVDTLTPRRSPRSTARGRLAEILDLGDAPARRAVARRLRRAARPVERPAALIVAGMGGSAVGGRLARGALGDRLTRPLVVADGYALPAGRGRRRSCCARATRAPPRRRWPATTTRVSAGAPRLVATTGGPLAERARRDGVPVIPVPGGFQPRAAVGYSLVSRAGGGGLAGAAPSLRDEIEAAAVLAESLAAEWGPDGDEDSEAKVLARALYSTVPVIMGAELASPRPTAGSASSTRTRSCRRSPRRCRRPTTTRSSAGPPRASSAGSRP